jgi:CheY-like chemotaxis protein
MPNAKVKILIVEDDPFLIKIMGNRLEEEGYIVDRSSDGEDALRRIKKDGYALILLDLIMPVKTGFEVLQELKDDGNKIPVLVFTNLAQDEDRREIVSLGAKGYYVKSDIAMDELVKVVKKYTYDLH